MLKIFSHLRPASRYTWGQVRRRNLLSVSSAAVQPLGQIALALGVSFYTTLVALVDSAILVLLLQLVQAREELAVNAAGRYLLVNLINRLYSGQ